MVLSSSPPFLLLLATLIRTSLQQTCYFPNGVIARDDYPCISLISKSPGTDVHCCEVGRTCLPNRMCSGNSQDENPMRGTCTDSTWDSPNCPKFCTPCKSPFELVIEKDEEVNLWVNNRFEIRQDVQLYFEWRCRGGRQ
jgi:hypothetical protein